MLIMCMHYMEQKQPTAAVNFVKKGKLSDKNETDDDHKPEAS